MIQFQNEIKLLIHLSLVLVFCAFMGCQGFGGDDEDQGLNAFGTQSEISDGGEDSGEDPYDPFGDDSGDDGSDDGGDPDPSPTPTPTPSPSVPPPPPGVGGDGSGALYIRDVDSQTRTNFPVKFAYPFKDGSHFPGQVRAQLTELSGTSYEIPIQVDVLRTNENNGSIRHAIITVLVPDISPSETLKLDLLPQAPSVSAPGFQYSANINTLDPRVVLTGSGGSPNLYGSLRDIVSDPTSCNVSANPNGEYAYYRINGPLYKECVVWGKMRTCSGSCSGSSSAVHSEIDYSIRIGFLTGMDPQIEFIVENSHMKLSSSDSTSTFQDHQFSNTKLTTDTSQSMVVWQDSSTLYLYQGTRWFLLGNHGNNVYDPEKIWDVPYLHQGRFIDLIAGPVSYNDIDSYGIQLWSGPNNKQLYPQNLGQTGGAPWIGPNMDWVLSFLASMSRKAFYAMETMDMNPLNSYFDTFFRRSTSTSTQKPGGDVGYKCGYSGGQLTNNWDDIDPGVSGTPGKPDTAHQPRIGFTSYLMTGRLSHYETMKAWNMWNMATSSWPNDSICLGTAPSRKAAWFTRNLTDLAWIMPNSDNDFSLVQTVLDENSEFWDNNAPTMGVFPQIPSQAGQWGLTNSGRLNFVNAGRWSAWQYDWMCWATHLAAKRGYTDYGSIRDWHCQTVIDLYMAEEDPSHNFTISEWDPVLGQYVNNTYNMPSQYADSYDLAHILFPDFKANQMTDTSGNPIPCDYGQDSGENVGALTYGVSSRKFVNYGEMWYWTMVNVSHSGWPVAQWCTTDFYYNDWEDFWYFDPDGNPKSSQAPHPGNSSIGLATHSKWVNYPPDGNDWSTYNGWYPPTSQLGEEYSHEPGWVATMEAVLDASATGTSTLDAAKAINGYTKYLNYSGGTPTHIELIPGFLN